MNLNNFFQTYFINPIYSEAEGYNYVNTIVYALLALGALYLIYKALQKLKIKIDFKFFLAVLPFIVLGSSLRAFVDHEYFKLSFWTVSPGIYLLIAGIFLAVFSASYLAEKKFKIKYWKACSLSGVFAVIISYIFVLNKLKFGNLFGGLAIIGLAAGISALLYFLFKYSKIKWLQGKFVLLPFIGHMLDASATFVIADFFGGWEKHPLTRFFSDLTGTAASLYFLKLLVLIPAVYLIRKELKDKELGNFLLIAVATLGLAEGLRDLLTLILV